MKLVRILKLFSRELECLSNFLYMWVIVQNESYSLVAWAKENGHTEFTEKRRKFSICVLGRQQKRRMH